MQKKRSRSVTFRIDKDKFDKLEAYAKSRKTCVSEVLREFADCDMRYEIRSVSGYKGKVNQNRCEQETIYSGKFDRERSETSLWPRKSVRQKRRLGCGEISYP